MSTSGILCFKTIKDEDIIENLENTEKLDVNLLKNDVTIYQHSDGGQIGYFLYYFLQDDALRKDDATSLTAWSVYELMTFNGRIKTFKDDKRQYYVQSGVYYDLDFIDYFFLVINAETVLVYEYGELRRVITSEEFEELMYIH